jgi:hypothetical protein
MTNAEIMSALRDAPPRQLAHIATAVSVPSQRLERIATDARGNRLAPWLLRRIGDLLDNPGGVGK